MEDLELRVRLFFHRLDGVILHRHVAGILFQRADRPLDAVQRGVRGRIGNRREVCGEELEAERLFLLVDHKSAGARRLLLLRDLLILRMEDRRILHVQERLIIHIGVFLQADNPLCGLDADGGVLHMVLYADHTVLAPLLGGVDLRGDGHLAVAGTETEEEIIAVAEHLELRVRVLDLLLDGVVLHGDAVCVLHDGADRPFRAVQSGVDRRFGNRGIVARLQLEHIPVADLLDDKSTGACHIVPPKRISRNGAKNARSAREDIRASARIT